MKGGAQKDSAQTDQNHRNLEKSWRHRESVILRTYRNQTRSKAHIVLSILKHSALTHPPLRLRLPLLHSPTLFRT